MDTSTLACRLLRGTPRPALRTSALVLSSSARPRALPLRRSVFETFAGMNRQTMARGMGVVAVFTLLQVKEPLAKCAGEASVGPTPPGKGPDAEDDPVAKALDAFGPLGGEITLGAITGFCSGYAVKKVGKAAAFMIGVTFIGVQVAAYTGVINVNWKKVEKEAITFLDQDGDNKLDKKDLLVLWGKFKKILLYQLPSSGGFLTGFALGFYKG